MHVLATELAHQGSRYGGDHDGHFIFPLLLLVLIGLAVFAFIRRRRGGGHHHPLPTPPAPPTSAGTATAMAVLQERFARGELDSTEYEHRRQVLEGRPATGPTRSAEAAEPADDDAEGADPTGDADDESGNS